jgi:hypothetical protein
MYVLYLIKKNVDKDLEAAQEWLERAVAAGSFSALEDVMLRTPETEKQKREYVKAQGKLIGISGEMKLYIANDKRLAIRFGKF